MKVLTLVVTFAFVATLHAQFPASELEPLAAKHKADQTTLDAQKTAAITRAQQPYLSALDSAERTATSAGTLEVVAAITKEREALKNGPMPPAFPEGLPKILQSPRKACLDAMARAVAEIAPRQKAIDADYFRVLTSLQAKAVGKPELAQQIAAEKEKLLAIASGEPDIAGKWEFTYVSGLKGVSVFFPNHTFKANDKTIAKWHVEKDKIILSFQDGGKEFLFLPINPKGTKGRNAWGAEFTAVRLEK